MSSYRVEVDEAAQRLNELLQAVEGGGTIIITRDGAPLASLGPAVREGGSARGRFAVADGPDAPFGDFRAHV